MFKIKLLLALASGRVSSCDLQNPGQIPVEIYDQTARIRIGRDLDFVDQTTNHIRRFLTAARIAKRAHELADLAPIACRHIGMEQDRRFALVPYQPLQFEGAVGYLVQLPFQRIGAEPINGKVDDALGAANHPFQLRLVASEGRVVLDAQPIDVIGVLAAKNRRERRVHQLVLQDARDGVFHLVLTDGPHVGAQRRTFVPDGRATVMGFRHFRHAAATAATAQHVGEEILGPLMLPEFLL